MVPKEVGQGHNGLVRLPATFGWQLEVCLRRIGPDGSKMDAVYTRTLADKRCIFGW